MLSFKEVKEAVQVVVHSGHVPNIVGLQGIGKTELVREFAKENGYEFEEITCSLLQEGDLAMPYLGKDNSMLYSVNSIISNLEERCIKNDVDGILLLDELNRAGEKAQSELMNLVLQRRIVGYRLSEHIKIVVAMNPNSNMKGFENTNYSVYDSDSAIMGRVLTLNMNPSLTDWLTYGYQVLPSGKTMVHPLILDFLKRNSNLFLTPEIEGTVNNTPRGWKCASDVLYSWNLMKKTSKGLLLNLLMGTLEEKTAGNLLHFIEKHNKGIDYYAVANQVINSEYVTDWDPNFLNYNDAELNKVFKYMCDIANSDKSELHIENMCNLVMCATPELAYSWISLLQKDYEFLYTTMLEADEKFSGRALELMMDVNVTEVGGFRGK